MTLLSLTRRAAEPRTGNFHHCHEPAKHRKHRLLRSHHHLPDLRHNRDPSHRQIARQHHTMKLTTLALLLSAGLASAQSAITLAWDANAPAEQVTGYKVYQKVTAPAVPPATAPVVTWKLLGQTAAATTTFTVQGVPAGTGTYAVSAFNAAGESDRSAELANTPIQPPEGLRVVVTVNVTVTP